MIIDCVKEFFKRLFAFFFRPKNRCRRCFKQVEDSLLEKNLPIKISCEDADIHIVFIPYCLECIRKRKIRKTEVE